MGARIFLVLLAISSAAFAAGCNAISLQQNWTPQQSEAFWFTSQGSRMMPYAWFFAMESPTTDTLFADPTNMDRFGFIRVSNSNVPIGFAKDTNAQTGETHIGLTCAACHTGSLLIDGKRVIVEGGPGMADFWMFLNEAVNALDATLKQPDKFDRFAKRLNVSGADIEPLRAKATAKLKDLQLRLAQNSSPVPFGYGRVDAFGHIFTRVLAQQLDLPANAKPPYGPKVLAPVSYPFLWDTPQHDVVQWNGSAPNTFTTGPMGRNVGEVLGVFGELEVTTENSWIPFTPTLVRYKTSANLENLNKLENMVRGLWSPVWPKDCVPLANDATLARGRKVYQDNCVGCHALLEGPERMNPNRKVFAQMKTLPEVYTDPTMAMNFAERQAETGRMKGAINAIGLDKFGTQTSGHELLLAIVSGIVLRGVADGSTPVDVIAGLRVNPLQELQGFKKALQAAKTPRYKARPLNGIWATAPYLHNGSVPTLWDLLTEESKRPAVFYVGSREFDPVKVGIVSKPGPGTSLFDTSTQGNWRNGHRFGTMLAEEQKHDLLEFLKTL